MQGVAGPLQRRARLTGQQVRQGGTWAGSVLDIEQKGLEMAQAVAGSGREMVTVLTHLADALKGVYDYVRSQLPH